jgi:hypothetical protein
MLQDFNHFEEKFARIQQIFLSKRSVPDLTSTKQFRIHNNAYNPDKD